MARGAKRARRAAQEQAKRERAQRQQAEDVLAHDELAREQMAFEEQRAPGLLRRMTPRTSSGGGPFSVFEEIFAPGRHQANLLLEVQRLVGAPAPAPSDPPFLEPVSAELNSNRYRGRVVIRKSPHADSADPSA